MNRDDAKKTIAVYELKNLSDIDKLEILEANYWFFGGKDEIIESIEDGSYPEISANFIELIDKTPSPIFTDESEILLIHYKIAEFRYVSNSYLKSRLKRININFEDDVTGVVEKAGLCPCCEYYSIGYGEDGLWDICTVCFWENGGNGPNHMTIEEAKLNFEKIGAMNESALKFVDKEGKLKYNKSSPDEQC